MIQLNPKHRQLFAEKILDIGHLAVGALIFGQFISVEPFNWRLTIAALSILFACYSFSYFLLKGE